MLKTIICINCKEKIEANPRLKGKQKYCGAAECQRARKRLWKHERNQNDESCRKKQIDYLVRWRRAKPVYQYMRDYRQKNPEYVAINRQKQQQRNKISRQREKAAKIVKVDALLSNPLKPSTYEMTRYDRDSSGKIVKVDTLMVQLKQIQALSLSQAGLRHKL
jgi:hypothetical protein